MGSKEQNSMLSRRRPKKQSEQNTERSTILILPQNHQMLKKKAQMRMMTGLGLERRKRTTIQQQRQRHWRRNRWQRRCHLHNQSAPCSERGEEREGQPGAPSRHCDTSYQYLNTLRQSSRPE